MRKNNSGNKIIAFFFLIIFSFQTFFPLGAFALSSGPTTPEMTAFEPASTANMVDLFSGDFRYNIPLLDVGGYPVNLSYSSGSGPEDEASWVGFGWSLNPGAINRSLRGVPDDFKGDIIEQYDNKKPNITVGGNINTSFKLFGNRLPKLKKNVNGSLKVKIGISHNNYTGYKGMIGMGTAFNASDDASDQQTENLGPTATDLSGGLGLNVDNQSGVNPYANFEVNFKTRAKKERAGEDVEGENNEPNKNIAASKEADKVKNKPANFLSKILQAASSNSGSISFERFHAPGKVQLPMVSTNLSAAFSLGPYNLGLGLNPGIEGTYSKLKLKAKYNTAPAYGFIHSQEAKSKEDPILDYNMEKESPYFKRLPNLGVTVFTPDLYSVSSNAGSMQFRAYLKGSGIFFQPEKKDIDNSAGISLEPGTGNVFHLGVPLQLNKTTNKTGKWTVKNDYRGIGDFKPTTNLDNQAYYFKRVGEKNLQDTNFYKAIGETNAVAVRLDNTVAAWAFGSGRALNNMRLSDGTNLTDTPVRNSRDKANHSIAFLTAEEAENYALQTTIPNYDPTKLPTAQGAVLKYIPRVSSYRKSHHISQFAVTQDDGQRMIYGVPVYNIRQEDVSFAISKTSTIYGNHVEYSAGADNSINNTHGKDNYFHKYITPSFTTGHLLSAILSPDYVDLTNNGITDDDLGSAVKFNYSAVSDYNGDPISYKWRTPYTNATGTNNVSTANYNEGYKSIRDDDKGNYSWGEKELWFLHSIESKTMVAHFITEDRDDGLGVDNENGGKNGAVKLKKLKEIRLYSKSDLYDDPLTAVPIKVVHFEYYEDDPIMPGMPNHATGKGKLTLKKIWFTYGNNTKGEYHSYYFKYNQPSSFTYKDSESDRWGTYRPVSVNNGLSNLEFPYATQVKSQADDFVSYWQLNEITLPSGAVINIEYESDDYAFVQDRRAMQMCFIRGIGGVNKISGFDQDDKIFVNLPVATKPEDLEKYYFSGMKALFYKAFVDLDNKGHYEYVSGYADIISKKLVNSNGSATLPGQTSNIVEITVGKINGYNPVSKSAWQKLKLDLPRLAYPEFDNLDAEQLGFVKAIKAMGATFGRFKDLVENFDKRADRKDFGDKIIAAKSWVRLNTPAGIEDINGNTLVHGKLGGGHRVKEIRIDDQWSEMSGVANAENGSYGQRYEYTIQNGDDIISSGVASYEPMMGGEENPFREPVNYVDKQFFGLPKYFYLERPMGESYFPGASVGYSNVTVKNLGADGSVGANGYTVSEFYTAKDFPTKVSELPMERRQPKMNFLPRLFGAKITSAVTVSQGYVVENNDMHGKPKAESVYALNGDKTSSAAYYYKVENENAEKQILDNKVLTVDKGGVINPPGYVGMDIEMFTEMNENKMENVGVAIDPSFGFGVAGIFPTLAIKLPLPKPNYEKRLYRGSSTIKLVNRYAILDKVVKTVNGSTNTTQNLLWDQETGEVLLTKTNNEYGDPVYTFNYPAHWVYDGMGSAFRNEGVYISGFNSDNDGYVYSSFNHVLSPGDELIDLDNNKKYWITEGENGLGLVDANGYKQVVTNINVKIMRSGRRNLAMASIGSVVSMNNPMDLVNNVVSFSQASKILQAKAVEYSDDWHMPVTVPCATGDACWSLNGNSGTNSLTSGLQTPYFSSQLANEYSIYGARIYHSGFDGQGSSSHYMELSTTYWKNLNQSCMEGPLNRAGIWPDTGLPDMMNNLQSSLDTSFGNSLESMQSPMNSGLNCSEIQNTTGRWLGHTFNYSTSTSKTLFIGIAGDNNFRFKINGTVVVSRSTGSTDNFRYWHIYPICLSPGNYTFEFQGYNDWKWGSVGAEVYDCTLNDLQAATSDSSVNILFSTRNLVSTNVEVGDGIGYAAPSGYYVYKNGSSYTAKQVNAVSPTGSLVLSNVFNPYKTGIRGNWRTKKELVYDALRVNNKPGDPNIQSTDLRNTGYFTVFNAYNWSQPTNLNWQWTAEAQKFNRKGQEVESKDALERFSAAQHGYLESVPIAIAGNAMHREIGFDGFEDYEFNLGVQGTTDSCNKQDHFSFRHTEGLGCTVVDDRSHSGRHSLKLHGYIQLQKPLLQDEPDEMYNVNKAEYYLTSNYLKDGLSPVPSKKYILSGWVYDGVQSATINGLSIQIDGQSYNVNNNSSDPETYSKIYVVEGWKRFEIVFETAGSGDFTLAFSGNNIYLDDLRIHPYESVLKSFVYDARSMRLWAELDENNFATFYEYDDEGTLIRVKKETEKGISTIKETRSSLRKKIQP